MMTMMTLRRSIAAAAALAVLLPYPAAFAKSYKHTGHTGSNYGRWAATCAELYSVIQDLQTQAIQLQVERDAISYQCRSLYQVSYNQGHPVGRHSPVERQCLRRYAAAEYKMRRRIHQSLRFTQVYNSSCGQMQTQAQANDAAAAALLLGGLGALAIGAGAAASSGGGSYYGQPGGGNCHYDQYGQLLGCH